MLITESISSDTSHKTTSRIISICWTIWEYIDDISSFIALTTTSACIISDVMFFSNSINVTFKWCINNFFLKTLFLFFFLRLFSLPTWFLLGLESFGSYHLVFEILVVSYSLTLFCKYWLPSIKLSLLYENIDHVYIWRKIHWKIKGKKENMEISKGWVKGSCKSMYISIKKSKFII